MVTCNFQVMLMRALKTPSSVEPRRAWATTRPSSVWRFQFRGRCTCGQTNIAPGNHASSIVCTLVLSGTSTTRRTTTSTTLRPRSSRDTSSTSSTQIWSTSDPRRSTSWTPAMTTKTLESWRFMLALRTRTSLSRSWTESGNIHTGTASAVSSPTGFSSCGSISSGTATGDEELIYIRSGHAVSE